MLALGVLALGTARADLTAYGPTPGEIRRRGKVDRGLPDRQSIRDLAEMYLAEQAKHWGESAVDGLIIESMVESFTAAFRDHASTPPDRASPVSSLAVAYLRYSDHNSNSRSLAQQLRNVLAWARQHDLFVPWAYVFGDAAITGRITARAAYRLCRRATLTDPAVRFLIVDDVGRSNRGTSATLDLGNEVVDSGRHLAGASDGFDSRQPQWKMLLTVNAMMHEAFVDSLRQKVDRGMTDGFERGDVVSGTCLGYRLVPRLDAQGRPVFRSNGAPKHAREIVPEEAELVREIFALYAEGRLSPTAIVRRFNEQGIRGLSWDKSYIHKILRRSLYRGVEERLITRRTLDRHTGAIRTAIRPKAERQVRSVPELRIVGDELWEKAQARLAQAGAQARRPRQQRDWSRVYLRRLDLVCGVCGTPLKLGHSSARYASVCCPRGVDGKHGCTLKGYKSLRHIEPVVLAHLQATLVTPEFVDGVTASANARLEELASAPPPDLTALRHAIADDERQAGRITAGLSRVRNETAIERILAEVDHLQARIDAAKARLVAAEASARSTPRPIVRREVEALLADLPGLLADEMASVAPVLAEITGPIRVTQEAVEGKKRPVWYGSFEVDGAAAMLALAKREDCPSRGTWEFLKTRAWTNGRTLITISLSRMPNP